MALSLPMTAAKSLDQERLMPEEQVTSNVRTPWHLWVVGIFAFLWSGMGAFDYLMTETQAEWYMGNFTPEQLEFFYGFPAWLVAFWALAVWGGVLGGILLLLRKKLAVPVFLVSFLCMVVTTIRNYGFANGFEVMGGAGAAAFSLLIFVFALLFYLYARSMRDKGVLV
jgi:hypothetical protein